MEDGAGLIKKLLTVLLAAMVLGAWPGAAGENRLQVELLNTVAGSPREPDNLKVRLDLPSAWAQEAIAGGDLRFFIYPAGLDPRLGATPRYQAAGVMLWRQERTVYADLRQPPQQEADGDYTLLAVLLRNGVVALSSFGSRPVTYRSGEVDVALVIDSSQSMAKNDPAKRRVAAAQAFIDTAARDGRISTVGLIRFNDEAAVLSPLTPLSQKEALLKPLAKIKADGMTNIGRALESAAEMLEGRKKNRRAAVVLLTDGKNESVAYADEHRIFAERGTPVYCVGLAKEADMTLLEKIAAQTGGKVFLAADHRGLMTIYQRIAAEIGRRQMIFSREVADAEVTLPVPVDGHVQNISFSVDAGPQEAELTLTPPDNRAGAEDGLAADRQAVEYTRDGYRELRVNRPAHGIWLVHIRRFSGNGALSLTVSGETKLFLDVFPPRPVSDGMQIAATLADRQQPLSGRSVVVLPSMGLGQTELFDDGSHGDGAAGDGVYSGLILAREAGKAHLLLQATGAGEEDFLRQADAGEAYLPMSPRANTLPSATITSAQPARQGQSLPEQKATLEANELDLGVRMPGQVAEAEFVIRYQGRPDKLRFRCERLGAAGNSAIDRPAFLLTDDREVMAGESRVGVRFLAPQDAAPGEYRGQATVQIGDALTLTPVRLRIAPVTLTAADSKMDLGFVRNGEPLRFGVPLNLHAPAALPVRVAVAGKALAVSAAELVLQPGQAQVLPLTGTIVDGLAPGEHFVRLTLSAGPARRELQVRFLIPEKGNTYQSKLTGHELALLLPGNIQRYALQVHEMRIPYTMPQTSAEPSEKAAAEGMPTAGTGRWLDAGLILLAALLLTALLLLLRKLSKNRMTRFALLSLALHLPLIAFVAGYLMLSSQPAQETPAPAFTAALSDAGESVEGGPGVPDKSLLAGVPVKEQSATRFLEPEKPLEPAKTTPSPAVQPETEKIALPAHAMELPQPCLPQVESQTLRLARSETSEPQTRRSPVPVSRTQPVPAVTTTTARQAVKHESTPAQAAVAKLAVQPVAMQPEREAVGLSKQSELADSNPLQLASAHDVDVSPVAERDRPRSDNRAGVRMQRSGAGKSAIAQTSEQAPDRQQELPKVSDLPVAGPSGGEGTARSIDSSVDVSDRSLRTLVEISPDQAGQKGTAARADSESLSGMQGVPEHQTLASVPLVGATRDTTKTANGGRTGSGAKSPQLRLLQEPAQPALSPVAKGETSLGDGVERAELIPAAATPEVPARVSGASAGQETFTAMVGSGDASPAEVATERTMVSGVKVARNAREERGGQNLRASRSDAPQQPQLAIPAALGAPVPAAQGGWDGSAKLVAERDRFSGGGGDQPKLAAPAGPSVRVESANILFSGDTARPQVRSAIAGGIRRTSGDSELSESGSANAGMIELTAGVVGGPAGNLFSLVGQNLPIHPVTAELNAESLSRCQVVIVTEKHPLNDAERVAVEGFLREGGRVWFCGTAMPQALEGMGRIQRAGAQHAFFTACYDLRQDLSSVELLDCGGLSAIATPAVAVKSLPAVAANALALLLGSGSDGVSYAAPEKSQKQYVQRMSDESGVALGGSAHNRPEPAGITGSGAGSSADGLPAGLPAEPVSGPVSTLRKTILWQDFSGLAEGKHGWSVENWGDPARLGLADDGQGGSALLAALSGTKGKAGISFVVPDYEGRRMDIHTHRELLLDVYQAGRGQSGITLLLTTYDPQTGWDEYQTSEVALRSGWNRDVSLSLVAVRSRRSGGNPALLQGAEHCAKLTLMLRAAGGNYLLDNLRWRE